MFAQTKNQSSISASLWTNITFKNFFECREKISALFFLCGACPTPPETFLQKKFRDFKKSYKNYGGNLLSYYQNYVKKDTSIVTNIVLDEITEEPRSEHGFEMTML